MPVFYVNRNEIRGSPCGSVGVNPTGIHEVAVLTPGLDQWMGESGVAMSCGVGRQLQLGFGPLPGNFLMAQVWP